MYIYLPLLLSRSSLTTGPFLSSLLQDRYNFLKTSLVYYHVQKVTGEKDL